VVAMQENAAEIHHKPDSTKLKKGFLVVDFGVKYKDLCSDCTRTFYLGKPSKKEKKLYDLVLNAQETGLKEAKIGAYNSDIDAIVRAVLVDYLFNFIHGTGHGVGKKVHKAPRVSPRSKSLLKNGDIITIEPGIYFKNKFGIRIEDTVFIGKKTKILTNTTKRLVCAKR
jgi:Xaa-Pro aminopeptidase